ncbi:alpha/beta fold hydrolase [Pseudomonas chlororaphis]|uniref:Alpha/beta hydrolase n=1 Tax=Pseudomonas chlororaphis TaxID=587753 RepID=A0A1Q8ERQ0_9PSED|nr:alpha/beta hydrolase [Pseudomonas chlororaphis]OLF54448.1 alpha/beta hydrolase [Pseudomonas chlororaphis]
MPTLVNEESRWIETPHGRLFSQCWSPAGEHREQRQAPIVLFHDSLGCVALWRDFPQRLCQATGREVLAYDRLGFGRSDAYPGELPTHFIQDEAERFLPLLLAHWRVERFVAFGHSVGGAMAATCAARYPRQCQALITESAQAFVEDRTRQGIQLAKQQFQAPGQLQRLHSYHGDKAPWVLAAWTDTWLSAAFASWTLESGVASIDCPLLVLHGADDEYGSLLHPERIARLASAPARCLILDGCRHVPHREAMDQVLEAVREHLRGACPAWPVP